MPLILGARNDATAKERTDRSGLAQEDLAIIAWDNSLRDADAAAAELAATCRKLDRLTVLLDDPALAATHPAEHPDRLDAEANRRELWRLRDIQRREWRRIAKRTDERWQEIPGQVLRDGLADDAAAAWDGSPALPLVRADVGLARLPFWVAVLAAPVVGGGRP